MMQQENTPRFKIIHTPTDDEMEHIYNAVETDKRARTNGAYYDRGVDIRLVLKDGGGVIRGGVTASMVYGVMHLEVLWVEESYRRHGFASRLVLGAEQIGFDKGCLAAQTWTFSFQGPGFYPTIGYEPIGIYDGYPNGITEHAFIKRLLPNRQTLIPFDVPDAQGFYLTMEISDADERVLHQGLHQHSVENIGDGYKGIAIKLVIKDRAGDLAGGLSAWTTLQNLIFEYVWVAATRRGQGLGRMLMEEMERIAIESGCIASQASCFSFQAPGFFEKMGYNVLGESSGYPDPVREYYLIKKYAGWSQKAGS